MGPGEILAFFVLWVFEGRPAGERALRPLATSDEGMLAGGGCVAGGCTPAKPPWSEVIIFLNHLLRQKDRQPEETVSSGEKKNAPGSSSPTKRIEA